MNSFNSWILNWFKLKNWKPQKFQLDTWGAVLDGNSGLVNAPTEVVKHYPYFLQ